MPAITSRVTSSVLSGGRAAIIFLKGAASSPEACQASSGGPGQGQETLCVATDTSRKPAEVRTPASLDSSAKRKTCGASGGAGGTFTCLRNGPSITLKKGFSSAEPQTSKEARPPGLRRRRVSE